AVRGVASRRFRSSSATGWPAPQRCRCASWWRPSCSSPDGGYGPASRPGVEDVLTLHPAPRVLPGVSRRDAMAATTIALLVAGLVLQVLVYGQGGHTAISDLPRVY